MEESPPDIECDVCTVCLYMLLLGGIAIVGLIGGSGEKSDEGMYGDEADPVKEERPPA